MQWNRQNGTVTYKSKAGCKQLCMRLDVINEAGSCGSNSTSGLNILERAEKHSDMKRINFVSRLHF